MFNCLKAVEADKIEGDIVECGVWRGGNILMARKVLPERTCWLYDTFDGMPEPDHELDVKPDGERAIDRYQRYQANGRNWDAVELNDVRNLFLAHDAFRQTEWVKGRIETTDRRPKKIAILRLDMDWHSPTKFALEKFYPLVSSRGFLIIDDYGHWLGCRKAVDDYFKGSKPVRKEIDYSCIVIRKC